MPQCIYRFLCCQNFITYTAVFSFCQTCYRACRCFCCINNFCMTQCIHKIACFFIVTSGSLTFISCVAFCCTCWFSYCCVIFMTQCIYYSLRYNHCFTYRTMSSNCQTCCFASCRNRIIDHCSMSCSDYCLLFYQYCSADTAMLTFCQTICYTSSRYCFIDYFCMACCRYYFLRCQDIITYRTVFTLCQACCCTCRCYCFINYICMAQCIYEVIFVSIFTRFTSISCITFV